MQSARVGTPRAPDRGMKKLTSRILGAAVLSTALLIPVASFAQDRDDHRYRQERSYHDRDHRDDHHWDNREDRAYDMWLKERRRKHVDFERLRANDQRAYWNWRHNHSDSLLHIEIR